MIKVSILSQSSFMNLLLVYLSTISMITAFGAKEELKFISYTIALLTSLQSPVIS